MGTLIAAADWTAPAGIAAWLACASFVLLMINQGFKLAGNVGGKKPQEISPQPFEIKAAAEHVHKSEFEKHASWNSAEHNNLFRKIGGVEREAAAALKADTAAIHEKVNAVAVAVAKVEKGMEFQNQQLASINQTVLSLLNRKSSSSLP